MDNLIIDSQTKRLRNGRGDDNPLGIWGIYLYIADEYNHVPEGHEIVEGFVSDIEGKYLPKWTGTEWVESATPEEIEELNRYSGDGNIIYPPESVKTSDEQITTIQLALSEIYDILGKDTANKVEIDATLIIKEEKTIDDIPENLRSIVAEAVEELKI